MLRINISFKIKDQIFHFDETVDVGERFIFNVGEPVLAGKLFGVLTGLDDDYEGTVEGEGINFSHSADNNVLALGDRTMFISGSVRRNIFKALRGRADKKTAKEQADKTLKRFGLLDIADKPIKKLDDEQLALVAYARAFYRNIKLVVVNCCETYIEKVNKNMLPNVADACIIEIN